MCFLHPFQLYELGWDVFYAFESNSIERKYLKCL